MTSSTHRGEPWFDSLAARVEERARIAHLDSLESDLRAPERGPDRHARLRVTVATGLLHTELSRRDDPDGAPLGLAELSAAEAPGWSSVDVPIEELLASWATAESFLADRQSSSDSTRHPREQLGAALREKAIQLHPMLVGAAVRQAPEVVADLRRRAISAVESFDKRITEVVSQVAASADESVARWRGMGGLSILTNVATDAVPRDRPRSSPPRFPGGPPQK